MTSTFEEPLAALHTLHRPTWAEISLDAVALNARRLAELARPAAIMAVVKADGYGHGAVECARAALRGGAAWLAVAALEEGLELRRAGLAGPVLIIGPSTPAQAPAIVAHDLHAAVFDLETARSLAKAGRQSGRPARAHLKVDTGMGRLGVTPDEDGADLARAVAALEGLDLDGVYTHYATSDEADKAYTRRQTELFEAFIARLAASGLSFRRRHAANTAALMDLPETRYDLVRVGISLYGLYPSADVDQSRVDLVPAMSWKTTLMHVKTVPAGTRISYGGEFTAPSPTVVGTLPVGYADGYRRLLSDRGRVLVNGARCRILGRVNMDHMMIDLSGAGAARVGDEVVLIGAQAAPGGGSRGGATPGTPHGAGTGDRITAEEVAAACGTINYEIVTNVGRRVPRVFVENGRPTTIRSILGSAPVGGDFP